MIIGESPSQALVLQMLHFSSLDLRPAPMEQIEPEESLLGIVQEIGYIDLCFAMG
jgi:hypothetical protein